MCFIAKIMKVQAAGAMQLQMNFHMTKIKVIGKIFHN